jgi:DNA-directed RNA polymerase specialized sigma24 family protein
VQDERLFSCIPQPCDILKAVTLIDDYGMVDTLYDEHRCLRRLAAGEDAWSEFLELFGGFTHNELARMDVLPGHDREDILQEILIRLLRHDCAIIKRHLAEYASTPFWYVLRTIIKTCRINSLRSGRRWRELEALDDEPMLDAVSNNELANDPALRVYRDVRLTCLLQDLAQPDRKGKNFQMLYLRFVEDESVSNIAGRLRLSPNAVTQRLKHCLKRGKARLQSAGIELKEASDG